MNSEAPLFFRASASCSKLLNDKNYIQYSEQFLGNSVFQGKRRCSKILDSKKYIQYGEKFQGNSVFRSSASCYQRWSNSGFLLSDPILFLKNLRLPWKQSFPEFTVLNVDFLYSGFLRNLRLPWKTELPWNFSLCWNIDCPENRVCPEIFQARGGCRPPRLVRLWPQYRRISSKCV